MSDEEPKKVGYKNPPEATRWKKDGPSPNPKGRPRKQRVERSWTRRQMVRDIVLLLEEPVPVRTRKGVVKMPTIVAMLGQAKQQALAGDRVSMRHLLKLYASAIDELEADCAPGLLREELEFYEKRAAAGRLRPGEDDILNRLRELTRRIE